ncbi:hypothetical protein RBWH47_06057 [Rhodopirellula baltica WH47]|uniref:Uncharacterized protein n=1 Tax=Rhodopirellula baltica WH47 TaxID=991778 RepID=F2AKG5_RHOBT|nr:hypothetical protein RBWH47_06057 [Rhodopirellula baltica WH47]
MKTLRTLQNNTMPSRTWPSSIMRRESLPNNGRKPPQISISDI